MSNQRVLNKPLIRGKTGKLDSKEFKRWRKTLDMSQRDAAHALGLKPRIIQYYEKGERDGKKVDIPLSVRLACYALTTGVKDYHGPNQKPEYKSDQKSPKRDAK